MSRLNVLDQCKEFQNHSTVPFIRKKCTLNAVSLLFCITGRNTKRFHPTLQQIHFKLREMQVTGQRLIVQCTPIASSVYKSQILAMLRLCMFPPYIATVLPNIGSCGGMMHCVLLSTASLMHSSPSVGVSPSNATEETESQNE